MTNYEGLTKQEYHKDQVNDFAIKAIFCGLAAVAIGLSQPEAITIVSQHSVEAYQTALSVSFGFLAGINGALALKHAVQSIMSPKE